MLPLILEHKTQPAYYYGNHRQNVIREEFMSELCRAVSMLQYGITIQQCGLFILWTSTEISMRYSEPGDNRKKDWEREVEDDKWNRKSRTVTLN